MSRRVNWFGRPRTLLRRIRAGRMRRCRPMPGWHATWWRRQWREGSTSDQPGSRNGVGSLPVWPPLQTGSVVNRHSDKLAMPNEFEGKSTPANCHSGKTKGEVYRKTPVFVKFLSVHRSRTLMNRSEGVSASAAGLATAGAAAPSERTREALAVSLRGCEELLPQSDWLQKLARSEAIYKTQKFSDHAPITVSYDMRL